MTKSIFYLSFIVVSMALLGISCSKVVICDEGPGPEVQMAGNGCPPVKLNSNLPIDPYTVNSASINGDCLELDVSYAGGCETHKLEVTWNGIYLESFPQQVDLQIRHNSNGDLCKALILQNLNRKLRRMQDPSANTVLVNILDDDGSRVFQLTYNY